MNQRFELVGYFKESTFYHPKILKPLLIIIFDYQEYIKPCHILELDPMSKLFIDRQKKLQLVYNYNVWKYMERWKI
jgi:hypothetical protein